MGGPIVIALFQFLQICRVKQSGLRVHLGLRSPAYTSSEFWQVLPMYFESLFSSPPWQLH